eukprot:SAG31_NODE_39682_length_286_cov_1.080214_1_plen_41_part_10
MTLPERAGTDPFGQGGGQPRATEAAASDLPHPKVTMGSGRA